MNSAPTLGNILAGVALMFPFFGIGLLVVWAWIKRRQRRAYLAHLEDIASWRAGQTDQKPRWAIHSQDEDV